MVSKQLIRRVWQNQSNKQLLITIPNDIGIEPGDYVSIKKIEDE